MYYYCTDHISTLLKINAFEVNAVFVRHLDIYVYHTDKSVQEQQFFP